VLVFTRLQMPVMVMYMPVLNKYKNNIPKSMKVCMDNTNNKYNIVIFGSLFINVFQSVQKFQLMVVSANYYTNAHHYVCTYEFGSMHVGLVGLNLKIIITI
jgi:hypothetical protein